MKTQGFTLIELLVVVLIIGILAAIAVPKYQKSVEISKASQVYTLLSNVTQAEQVYFLTKGSFTANLSNLDIKFPYTISVPNQYVAGGDFYWRICMDASCIYAGRKWKDGFYIIQADMRERSFVCAAKQNTKAIEICNALGFTEKYTSSPYTPWINSDRNNCDYYKKPN